MTIKEELSISLMGQLAAAGPLVTADDITLAWLTILRKFAPLIGAHSVLLMFERSVDTQLAHFAWLPKLALPMQPEAAIDQLRISMATRANGEMLTAHRAVLATFVDLITTLIGSRLTVQFLGAAFPAVEANSLTEENSG
jgi:hypothetical protein